MCDYYLHYIYIFFNIWDYVNLHLKSLPSYLTCTIYLNIININIKYYQYLSVSQFYNLGPVFGHDSYVSLRNYQCYYLEAPE